MNFIFDLYGTLADIKTDEGRRGFWRDIAARLGAPRFRWRAVRREYLALCREKKRKDEQEIDLCEVFRDMLSAHGRGGYAAEVDALAQYFRERSTEKLRLFAEVSEMLAELRSRGCGVYLVSNAQASFTVRELDLLGLTPAFDGIILSSDVGVKKPSVEIFEIASKRFGIKTEDSVYVGNDMRDDILGATRAGIRTVYIETEQSGRYEGLTLPAPTYTVKDHRALRALLLSMAENG